MSYASCIEQLLSFSAIPRDQSLAAIGRLDEALGCPSRLFPAIHVAGTNGKGSVTLKMATALHLSGYRTGLYTSPHLFSVRERIQVGGVPIPRAYIEQVLPRLFEEARRAPVSFFHLLTALAFSYFADSRIDIAVIEAGIGGRFDATHRIQTVMAAITSIGFDHRELLGETLDQIAWEKAGIFKPEIPVVIGPTADFPAVREEAAHLGCRIYKVEERGPTFDADNTRVAHVMLKRLRDRFPRITDSAIEAALLVRPPCRFEVWEGERTTVLDVAHNPPGFQSLLDTLYNQWGDRPLRFVVGFSKGKDVVSCLNLLISRGAALHCVGGAHTRLIPSQELQEMAQRLGARGVSAHEDAEEGLKMAWAESREGEVVVVAGSFYLMRSARLALGSKEETDDSSPLATCGASTSSGRVDPVPKKGGPSLLSLPPHVPGNT